MTNVIVTGSLNKVPDTGRNFLLALGWYTGGLCYGSNGISSTGPYTLTVDFKEPLSGTEIPAICILNQDMASYAFTIIPVKFEQ